MYSPSSKVEIIIVSMLMFSHVKINVVATHQNFLENPCGMMHNYYTQFPPDARALFFNPCNYTCQYKSNLNVKGHARKYIWQVVL